VARLTWAVVVVATALVGCGPAKYGDEALAESTVTRWLQAAAAPAGDRGWSLLDPSTRTALYADTPEHYIAKAESADWSKMEWTIGEGTYWDGVWTVRVLVPGGMQSVPKFVLNDPLAQRLCDSDQIVGILVTVVAKADGAAGVSQPARTGSAVRLECP
jgi:hypothetical protein